MINKIINILIYISSLVAVPIVYNLSEGFIILPIVYIVITFIINKKINIQKYTNHNIIKIFSIILNIAYIIMQIVNYNLIYYYPIVKIYFVVAYLIIIAYTLLCRKSTNVVVKNI